jgi:ATP-dependent DNA ligase
MKQPLSERRELLASIVQPGQSVGLSQVSNSSAEILEFVKAHGLEGVVAKRADSVYQPGLRTGLWSKHRVNQRGEFVIGGYVPSHLGVDSILPGEGSPLRGSCASRLRSADASAGIRSYQGAGDATMPIR